MQGAQQRTTARLLRRALEAVLPPNPLGVVDAVAERVKDALPPTRSAELLLWNTEVDVLPPARPRYPWLRRFDPYRDLFTFNRVATQPWDTAWRNTPLVLRDVDLLHAVDFPPYHEAEPYEHGDSIKRILQHHTGPVESLRVDASSLPPPETLGSWLDLLSARSVTELVLLDVGALGTSTEFPLRRLRCPGLSTLALGFVSVRLSWCWLSGLEALFLVACHCSARDLSEVMPSLPRLQTLGIFAMDLAPAGAGATATAGGDGHLDISSESLSSLEFMETTVTALTLGHAPALKNIVTGVVPPEVKNHRVRPMTERARPPVRIYLRHTPGLETIRGLVLWQRRQVISVVSPLSNLETLEAALEMAVAEQWSRLLILLAQMPGLRCLQLTRVDELCENEKLNLEPHPACFQKTLQELRLKDYRAGGSEVSLVTTLLTTGAQLTSVRLYPHKSLPNPGLAHINRKFWNCKCKEPERNELLKCTCERPAARIEVCQPDPWEWN